MRKIVTLLVLSIFPFCIVFGQTAVVHIALANGKASSCYVRIPGQPKNGFNLPFKDNHNASYTFQLTRPEFVIVYCSDSDDRNRKQFGYIFYLSPGDNLELKADFNEPRFGFKVIGKGSNNNQPLISAMDSLNISNFQVDTIPYRVINAIKTAQKNLQDTLAKYITLYKPSPTYIHDWRINLNYYACDLYYDFKENNKFAIQQAYKRDFYKWQKIADSLFSIAKLNNDTALTAFHYTHLVSTFLDREKERLWSEEWDHPERFYRAWYQADTVEGKKQFKADPQNLVHEKIISKYFTGKTAEYLYGVLLKDAANESNPANIPAIFGRFKEKYPNSEYIAQFGPSIDTIIAKQKQAFNERMVFMADNGTKLNSLDEVLAAMKGKTVLVDMWGTWCGPCREEIEKNSAAIREHFKGKGLTYLYIANKDLTRQDQWKRLIAYFNMEGTHVLANKALTDDIMAKVNGDGLPTVFIIKKDGSFELSRSRYPIKLDILFKQLDEDLAQ